eukprot:TRINITY_DN3047_c0_g1_i1.p1 TRINITY_DN3047_c0_g1~~TRINITY_DN3047_c0_g1_i1.p1  ORF type:complete len:224 (+),score=62.91 TRINITY_DN3047_c0_g1_i1:152-823(+)
MREGSEHIVPPHTTAEMIEAHKDAFIAATNHDFLDACADGTVGDQQFNTWLLQDYLFVLEFSRMAGRALSNAPDEHVPLLLGGLAALKEELVWFKYMAQRLGVDLSTAMKKPTNQEYCAFMRELAEHDYTVQLAAYWAIELVYNKAWQLNGKTPRKPLHQELQQRWGNQELTAFVTALAEEVDKRLHVEVGADEVQLMVQRECSEVFGRVMALEVRFWHMAYE